MNRQPHAKRYRARTITLLSCAALLVAGACAKTADQGQNEKQKPQPSVKTAPVEARSLTERLELTGSITPTQIARMASPVDGPIIACPVREGDRVRPGQLLVRLGRTKGDDAVAASAKAELDREELELGRIEKLVKTGALPGEELEKARVKVSAAQARLARAMEKLGDYRLSAPWAGVVSRVNVAVGDFVSARETLVELFDPASLVLRFAVPEDAAARVQSGAVITVTLDAHSGRSFSARVTRIYPDIDSRTHTRTIEATIEDDVVLAPGMFARLQLILASIPEALTVPVEAVIRRDGKPIVFVIQGDTTVDQRPVEIGLEDDGHVQILAGVAKGEEVAVAGHNRLRDGKQVRVAKGQGSEGGKKKQKAAPGKGEAR
ncbi:MAG: efflux RND transporter periplasmic adaptor subunit [Polyangia bacterium]